LLVPFVFFFVLFVAPLKGQTAAALPPTVPGYVRRLPPAFP